MIPVDPHLVVRAGAVYVTLILTLALIVWRRPGARTAAAAMLAALWNVPVILALHLLALRAGWWEVDADGGTLLGLPVDLLLAWVCLWAVIPVLAWPRLSLIGIVALVLAADVVLMPALEPVIVLGERWWTGEALGLLAGLVPGQLLARWTIADAHLPRRVVLQLLAFGGLLLFVLPAIAIEASGGAWVDPRSRPVWQLSLFAQLLALASVPGLSAVQEFCERGGGTPVPFDPPVRLVRSGVYTYVANPMQLSGVATLLLLGVFLENVWVSAAGVVAHVYSIGLAAWDEGEHLRAMHGDAWTVYRRTVRAWLPHWAPRVVPGAPTATLYVSQRCEMCRGVGAWLARHRLHGLRLVAAEQHQPALIRMTYVPGDGSRPASGIEALARALEHVNLGWACAAFMLRLPLIRPVAQLLADASGAHPRPVVATGTARACAGPEPRHDP